MLLLDAAPAAHRVDLARAAEPQAHALAAAVSLPPESPLPPEPLLLPTLQVTFLPLSLHMILGNLPAGPVLPRRPAASRPERRSGRARRSRRWRPAACRGAGVTLRALSARRAGRGPGSGPAPVARRRTRLPCAPVAPVGPCDQSHQSGPAHQVAPVAPDRPARRSPREKRPSRSSALLVSRTDPSEASVNSFGTPLPRGSAHSVTTVGGVAADPLLDQSDHHTPVAPSAPAAACPLPSEIDVIVGVGRIGWTRTSALLAATSEVVARGAQERSRPHR